MDFLTKLDMLMAEQKLNKSTLSIKSGIPYTTIDGWYKKGYEGLKLTTLKKLANFFNTELDFWVRDENNNKTNNIILSKDEKRLIAAYRKNPEMQKAVDKLLGLPEQDTAHIYRAAHSEDNAPDQILDIPAERMRKIKEAPETDDEL